MAYNKFVSGNTVLLDLSNDDLDSDTSKVPSGLKYHGKDGIQYTGTAVNPQYKFYEPIVGGGLLIGSISIEEVEE